jgi:peptide/nickel transport system ATP-binding protein
VSAADGGRLLATRGLTVRTRAGRTIVRGVDLHVDAGETVGIVGESGSGKSMTAKALIGLLPSGLTASGEVLVGGRDLLQLRERELRRVRGGEIALVMQDPFTMLNPLLRCGVQVTDGLAHGRRRMRRAGRRAEAVRRLAEVGIRDPAVADRFPFELSGGMRQRVGIAAALARDPGLLIADEPSTALDVTTQSEILDLLRSLQASRGMGLILITHDLRVAAETCERIHVMYAGGVVEVAPAAELDTDPRHPYTLGLLCSEPPADRRLGQLPVIEGSVPRPDEVAQVCPFAARCEWAQARCQEGHPPLMAVGSGNRLSACLRSEEIHAEMRVRRQLEGTTALERRPVGGAPLVAIRDLVKSFPGRSAEAHAVDGVSLEIGQRESVGLVGESGSGKTTLARCLMGLERPSAGEIEIDGVPAHSYAALSASDRADLRHKVQMVFQDPYSSLNPVRTIGATLLEAIQARESRERAARSEVDLLLQRVGLPAEYAQRKPAALSGGERQRVAIARALAMRPRLIVCDEPVSALDVSVQAQILNLLTALREEYEVSYLFITHDLAVVRQVVERVYVLLDGRIVESGQCDAVLDHPRHPYTQQLVASIPGAAAPSEAKRGEQHPSP